MIGVSAAGSTMFNHTQQQRQINDLRIMPEFRLFLTRLQPSVSAMKIYQRELQKS
ncbi:hypothetical protein IAE33_001312 [Pseudomonas sp. S60]|nr:hypothetical protein [Pseudomonas sp. S60]